jgi:hypothetical protein
MLGKRVRTVGILHPHDLPDVVHHDSRIREVVGQACNLGQLVMEDRGVENKIACGQLLEAGAELGVAHDPGRRRMWDVPPDRRISVLHGALTEAAQSVRCGRKRPIQQLGDCIAKSEIRVADDRGGDTTWTVLAGGADRRDSIRELDLAYWPEHLRAVWPMHGHALHVYGRNNVVPSLDVLGVVLEHVVAVAPVAKMMMRVYDRELWLQDGAV